MIIFASMSIVMVSDDRFVFQVSGITCIKFNKNAEYMILFNIKFCKNELLSFFCFKNIGTFGTFYTTCIRSELADS